MAGKLLPWNRDYILEALLALALAHYRKSYATGATQNRSARTNINYLRSKQLFQDKSNACVARKWRYTNLIAKTVNLCCLPICPAAAAVCRDCSYWTTATPGDWNTPFQQTCYGKNWILVNTNGLALCLAMNQEGIFSEKAYSVRRHQD